MKCNSARRLWLRFFVHLKSDIQQVRKREESERFCKWSRRYQSELWLRKIPLIDERTARAAVCPTCIFVSLCPSTAQWRALCCGSSSHQIIQWFLMGGRTLNLFCQIFIGNLCSNPFRAPPAPPFHPFASSLLRKYIVDSWSHISRIAWWNSMTRHNIYCLVFHYKILQMSKKGFLARSAAQAHSSSTSKTSLRIKQIDVSWVCCCCFCWWWMEVIFTKTIFKSSEGNWWTLLSQRNTWRSYWHPQV